jgi:protein involved in polysaccharide export with SLBB domain
MKSNSTILGNPTQHVAAALSRWISDRKCKSIGLVSLAAVIFASSLPAPAAAPRFSELPDLSAPVANSSKTSVSSTSSQTATNSSRASTNSMDALDSDHTLAIGDRLSFRIIEDEDDPKQLVVTDSGDLECPYIGRYPAVGKSCRDLARALKAELEKDYYFQATVIIAVDVMAKSRGKVYLVGPVRAPGPLEVPSDEVFTLSKAILRAGGFTDFADKKSVRVTRKTTAGSEQVFKVNVAEVLDKGKTQADMTLQAGDLIVIPERTIRF